jgi:hypothetical protein
MSLSIDFSSKECKNKNHLLCKYQWEGFGLTVICTCNCHKEISQKNIVLDGPDKSSNTHCSNHILNLASEAD